MRTPNQKYEHEYKCAYMKLPLTQSMHQNEKIQFY